MAYCERSLLRRQSHAWAKSDERCRQHSIHGLPSPTPSTSPVHALPLCPFDLELPLLIFPRSIAREMAMVEAFHAHQPRLPLKIEVLFLRASICSSLLKTETWLIRRCPAPTNVGGRLHIQGPRDSGAVQALVNKTSMSGVGTTVPRASIATVCLRQTWRMVATEDQSDARVPTRCGICIHKASAPSAANGALQPRLLF